MSSIKALKKAARQQLKGRGIAGFWVGILLLILCAIPLVNYFTIPFLISSLSYYYLKISRGESPCIKHLFLSYRGSGKVYVLNLLFCFLNSVPLLILTSIQKVFLITMSESMQGILLIALSILLVYCLYPYRQTAYLLMDDPERRVTDALDESNDMMNGYKMKLFRLDASYGVWFFVVNIIVSLFICIAFLLFFTSFVNTFREAILSREALNTSNEALLESIIIIFALCIFQIIFFLLLIPRYFTTQALFYNELVGITPHKETDITSASAPCDEIDIPAPYIEEGIPSTYTQYTDVSIPRHRPKPPDSMGKIDYFNEK